MIYYVEDDENIRNLAIYALEGKGLQVRGFARATEFYAALERELPDAILLDIMLPGDDGLTILRRLRENERTAHIPLMMITARGTEFDIVTGLDGGADDYLTKPFGMMELISRVNALLRRVSPRASEAVTQSGRAPESAPQSAEATQEAAVEAAAEAAATQADNATTHPLPVGINDEPLKVGTVALYPGHHRVEVDGKTIALTLKEFDILRFLMENQGLVFTREHLLETVWGWDFAGNSRTVDTHIQTLRQKLDAGASIIQTVRGVGYRCQE